MAKTILMIYPETYGWEETGRFIREAFNRQGYVTYVFDNMWRAQYKGIDVMNESLLKYCKLVKPDFVFILKGEFIYPVTLSQISCPKIYWHPDVRKSVQQWVVDLAQNVDIFYTMSKGSLEEYKKQIYNAKYLPEACDPHYHFYAPNVDNFWKSDVNFIGTVRGSRIDMCKRIIESKFNFKIWGSLGKMEDFEYKIIRPYFMRRQVWREYHSYVASGAISVTWDWAPEIELSYSARIYRVMASRGLYLAKYVKGMEKVFKRGVHLDWYETLDEMVEKIRYYLFHPEEKKRIGLNAQKEVYTHHTFDVRVKQIIKDMKKL